MLARLLTAFKSRPWPTVAIGALVYAVWRIEHWRKTFDSLLSEVDEQFEPRGALMGDSKRRRNPMTGKVKWRPAPVVAARSGLRKQRGEGYMDNAPNVSWPH